MKLLKPFILSLFLIAGLATAAQAQIKAGAGLAWGSEIEELGLELIGEYQITDVWGAGASIIYWFDGIEDFTFLEVNADGHYTFFTNEKFDAYALAGLNFSYSKVKIELAPPLEDINEGNTEVGLNVGAGGHMMIADNLTGRAQIRYTLGDFDQLVISAGVLFGF